MILNFLRNFVFSPENLTWNGLIFCGMFCSKHEVKNFQSTTRILPILMDALPTLETEAAAVAFHNRYKPNTYQIKRCGLWPFSLFLFEEKENKPRALDNSRINNWPILLKFVVKSNILPQKWKNYIPISYTKVNFDIPYISVGDILGKILWGFLRMRLVVHLICFEN